MVLFRGKKMAYNLRDGSKLVLPKTKSSCFGINSLQFRGSLYGIIYLYPLKTVKVSMNLNYNYEICEISIVLA